MVVDKYDLTNNEKNVMKKVTLKAVFIIQKKNQLVLSESVWTRKNPNLE